MKVVIATERSKEHDSPNLAEIIISKLKNIPDFKGWTFEVCHSEEELYGLMTRPDVIVVSRYLSDDMENVFKHLPLSQPHSRIVLLAGELNVKTRAFIKMAEDYGINNIVTGQLPGDRPYTLLVAIKYDKSEITGNDSEMPVLSSKPDANELLAGLPVKAGEQTKTERLHKEDTSKEAFTVKNTVSKEVSDFGEIKKEPQIEKSRKRLIIKKRPGISSGIESAGAGVPVKSPVGVSTLVSANKGGVGKTTVAVTVAVGLSRARIRTCLVDLDFGGPDVAPFFKISEVCGIEVLQKLPINPTTVSDLLYKVNDYLYVLPGTMDKSLPYFNKEQIDRLLNSLRSLFPVTVFDTPQQFWTKEYLEPVFEKSEFVLSVVDQSLFSEHETAAYAPKLSWYGVAPERIRIVLNRYSTRLHNAKIIEKYFNMNIKDVPKHNLPRVVVTAPNNWDDNILKGYKGEVILDDNLIQWKPLLSEIAESAGFKFDPGGHKQEKKSFLGGIISNFRRSKV